ncbi:MFS transporter [Actinopolymorpha rutila]|uniref:EmrB/QacA subfamily drug resistance transporter n=1 Tax=Actinopolymorpha rutila TaxID=446787 RepID=A0A852ZFK4_9ACTN|nr:EmrB/QacA subfamily drug resistance transporter [Actinopolymorpha rutila]
MSNPTAFTDRPTPTTGEPALSTAPTGRPRATLFAALLGFFVVTLDAVIVNVALPSIRRDLGGGIAGLQWVVDAYTLAFAALLLTSGSLADRIGAKRAFGAGLALFVAASLVCGVAPNLTALVAARVLQGAAAALMMPASLALVGQAYPDPRRRAHAVAAWAMGGAVASTSGPVFGGLLTLASWRWIFLVNLPVGPIGLLLLRGAATSPVRTALFDPAGQVAGVVTMAALTFGAVEAGAAGLTDVRVLTAFVIALCAGIAFVLVERRVPHPMVPLTLFRSGSVVGALVVGFAFMVGYYGLPFVMSLFLQQERGLSPLQTGVVFLPMMLVGLCLTPLVPHLTHRVGARPVIIAGLMCMVAGLAAVALAPSNLPLSGYGLLMVLVGLAGPTVAPPITAVLLNSVAVHRAGTASGLLNTSRQLGGALAIAVFGALLSGQAGFGAGVRTSLLVATAVAVVAALTAARSLGRHHQIRE